MQSVIDFIFEQWDTVTKAPSIFLVGGAIVASATWLTARRYFKDRIDDLESRLKLRDEQIEAYEKASGAISPEELQQRMAITESRIQQLAEVPPSDDIDFSLSDAQLAIVKYMLQSVDDPFPFHVIVQLVPDSRAVVRSDIEQLEDMGLVASHGKYGPNGDDWIVTRKGRKILMKHPQLIDFVEGHLRGEPS